MFALKKWMDKKSDIKYIYGIENDWTHHEIKQLSYLPCGEQLNRASHRKKTFVCRRNL